MRRRRELRQGERRVEEGFYPDPSAENLVLDANRKNELKARQQLPVPVVLESIELTSLSLAGLNFLSVQIWFSDESDPIFAGARIWLKGYGTNNLLGTDTDSEEVLPFQLMTVVDRSPATLLLFPTDEEVVLGVESVNIDGQGSGIDKMPTQAFTMQ